MASHSNIMPAIRAHAARGGKILGVCNGFQILTEAGLLPGVLLRNKGLRFICKDVHLKVEDTGSHFTRKYAETGNVISLPVAHHDGNYYADSDTLKALEDNRQIAFRYCSNDGTVEDSANPNGSARHIAGIFNKERTILGMMPHPERAVETATCHGNDGLSLFHSLLAA
jgi:phosphoribosylformylglycinamidine synthase